MGKSTVSQKLMKLLDEVNDATWPAVAFACPSDSKPVAITEESRVRELWASSVLVDEAAAAVEEPVLVEEIAEVDPAPALELAELVAPVAAMRASMSD